MIALDNGKFLEWYPELDSEQSELACEEFECRGVVVTLLQWAVITAKLDVVKFLVRNGCGLLAVPPAKESVRPSYSALGFAVQSRCFLPPPKDSAMFAQMQNPETPPECVVCERPAAVMCSHCVGEGLLVVCALG